MAANPAMLIRIAANLAELKKNLAEGKTGLIGWVESLGDSMAARIAEGVLLRDAVRGVIDMGKEAFADAARFEDLSKATGISIQSIQALGYVGVEFGVDLEQMARGV